MPLTPGTRLGPYEILSAIGAGGMGEVYKARDSRLDRTVAIKILPEAFAADADRIARFQREAKTLAALNHPNIAQIFGLEQAGDVHALAMEFVAGEDLSERIALGPIPIDEAVPIAKQIAEALEAAHEQGIIHRDLKPANIKVTPNGIVKVLDFGLAKALDPVATSNTQVTNSPTLSMHATQAGIILGTAAYMSPEQAKGREVDKRSDVWGFGCVLYEMLAGRRAFDGEDMSDTLAAILRAEPDWSALPPDVPRHVRIMIERCLKKDRKLRIADFSTIRFVLDEGASLASTPVPAIDAAPLTSHLTGRLRLWQALAGICVLTTLAGLAAWYLDRPAAPATTRFLVLPPENGRFVASARVAANVAISPDGQTLAFTSRDNSGKTLLWLRPIDALVAHPLTGTDDAAHPFWSPDSRFIGYSVPGKMMKVSASGGPPQTLCTVSGGALITARGGAWSRDGVIVFNNGPGSPLYRVSSGGGQPSPVGQLDPGMQAQTTVQGNVPRFGNGSQDFPSFLPDGHHVLSHLAASEDRSGVYVTSLDTGESKRLLAANSGAIYTPATGHLLFVRDGTLLAQSFDPQKLELANDPFPVAENVESEAIAGLVSFSVSANGTLAYGVGTASNSLLQMVWVDRQGKQIGTIGPPGNYRGLDLSSDGTRVAAHRHDGNGGNIWVSDLSGRTSQLTFDAAQENSSPVWSPDGTAIAYGSRRNAKAELFQRPSNNSGNEEQLLESDNGPLLPMSWSPSGEFIVFEVPGGGGTAPGNEWLLPLSGDRKPRLLLRSAFQESHGQVSPDGKWLAYYSAEAGPNQVQIVVVPFPIGDGKHVITTTGGLFPRWRHDGRELFYLSQASLGKMMSVDVKANGMVFESGVPKELFDSGYLNLPHGRGGPYHTYAVSPDGQRFLIPRPVVSAAPTASSLVVVTNWVEELKARVSTK